MSSAAVPSWCRFGPCSRRRLPHVPKIERAASLRKVCTCSARQLEKSFRPSPSQAVESGEVRQLGISNCYDLGVFRLIYDAVKSLGRDPSFCSVRSKTRAGIPHPLLSPSLCKSRGSSQRCCKTASMPMRATTGNCDNFAWKRASDTRPSGH